MLHVMNHDNDLWSALFFSSPIGCYFFFFYWNNNDWTNHLPGLQIVTSLADPFGWKFFKRLCWWILLSSSWGVHKWKCFLRQPLRLSSTTTRVKRKKKKKASSFVCLLIGAMWRFLWSNHSPFHYFWVEEIAIQLFLFYSSFSSLLLETKLPMWN